MKTIIERPELKMLKKQGYSFDDPWEVINLFENKVAKFAGSKYAVAVDSCTNALFLSLVLYKDRLYEKLRGIKNLEGMEVAIPRYTYFSVPMAIQQAGFKTVFNDKRWCGGYWLGGTNVWDGAVRWSKNMYYGGFHCLSFQIKKNIPIGKGGMILTDDFSDYVELKCMRYDGRDMETDRMDKNHIKRLGYHMYMTPEDAARGILLMDKIPGDLPDMYKWSDYPDLTQTALKYLV